MIRMKEIVLSKWLNLNQENSVDLKSPTIRFIHFFQVHCPGCIEFGIPETVEVFQKYHSDELKVFAIHSVFEDHAHQDECALQEFITRQKLPFAVGIDKHLEGEWMPQTMKNYDLQGTPTTLIIDREGFIQLCHLGHFDRTRLHNYLDKLLQSS